jgi:DnaK suppressor protein
MNQNLIDELKQALEKEKKELLEGLNSFASKDKNLEGDWDTKYQDMGNDWDSNSQEVTEYATKIPIEHELELKLQNVEDALGKISKSTYGICEKCGEPIDEERLKADPSARNCVQHS